MNQKTSKVEKEFYLRCSYLTLSVLFDKEPYYSTVTDFAKLRGLSTSNPRNSVA